MAAERGVVVGAKSVRRPVGQDLLLQLVLARGSGVSPGNGMPGHVTAGAVAGEFVGNLFWALLFFSEIRRVPGRK